MTKADIDNLPNYAGIYLIKNKINNKYYVGQAIKLRTRLRQHYRNFINDKYPNIVLYKAFRKYGIENFELKILDTFRDALDWRVPRTLDELEKKYIQEYNSYDSGYNSTLGGDTGVLGYKHSEETKKEISKCSIEHFKRRSEELKKDSSNWIQCRHLETEEIKVFKSAQEVSVELGINKFVVYNCLHKRQRIASKIWQIAHYNEEFEKLPKYGSDEFKELLNSQYSTLANKKDICEYIKANPKCTYGQISQDFLLSKKTFFNYKNELGLQQSQRVDTKVTKEEFVAYYKDHSVMECVNHFNITIRRCYKYIKKYIESNGREIDI